MGRFVLVHGAFDGSWAWARLARVLRSRGHEVYTPTLTGCGAKVHLLSRAVSLETHIEDVTSFLFHEDLTNAVLVGHSYAGAVVTGAADRVPERVKHVVYLDAAAPVAGQSASGAFTEGTADKLEAMSEGDGWLLPPLPSHAIGISETDAPWFEARRHPHPLRTLQEPLRLGGAIDRVPRSYVTCKRHEGLVTLFGVDPLTPFVERAKKEGWRLTALDAPHEVMFTHPDEVAEVLAMHA
jgi:pimeloyl-ACP methyl ester carboxylesterase